MKTINDNEIIETSRGRKRIGALFDENAMLHAANAELLAALETLHDATKHYFRDFEHLHPSISGPLELARAALAKARGA